MSGGVAFHPFTRRDGQLKRLKAARQLSCEGAAVCENTLQMRSAINRLAAAAPAIVAYSLIAGNVGLLLKHGLHPNLETAVGFLWIASDYALRQKNRHPVAAPRLNSVGVILGSLCLSASGLHPHFIDWYRIRAPLGYIPAAAVIGFQKELRAAGAALLVSASPLAKLCGAILARPYTLAAGLNAYGVVELARSAIAVGDGGLLAISIAYGIATVVLPFLDDRRYEQSAGLDSRLEALASASAFPQPDSQE